MSAGTNVTPPVEPTLRREPLALRRRLDQARARHGATGAPRRRRGPRPLPRIAERRRARPRRPSSAAPPPGGPAPRRRDEHERPRPVRRLRLAGAKQPWPKSAACWSPAIPAIGTARPRSVASARTPDEGTTRAAPRGRRRKREQLVVPVDRREVEQHRPRRVRHVGDVRAHRPSASRRATSRPSRTQARLPGARCARGSTRASWPRSTGRERARSARGSAATAARRSARPYAGPARRSPGATGRPVPRSQTTVVSRWFVIPIAARSVARMPAAASASSAAAATLAQISSGSCSTHPGCGNDCADLAVPAPDRAQLVVDDEAGRPGRSLVDCQDHGASRPASPKDRGADV